MKLIIVIIINIVFTSCYGQENHTINDTIKKNQTDTIHIFENYIYPDSLIIDFYGDSITNIIFYPDSVICYTLKQLVKPDSLNTLSKFAIDRKVVSLEKSYYSILQFLIQNKENYEFKEINKCVFAPSVGFLFYRNNKNVFFSINFDCNKWSVEHLNKLIISSFKCDKQLKQFVAPILKYK